MRFRYNKEEHGLKQLTAVLLCAAACIRNNFASNYDLASAVQEQGISQEGWQTGGGNIPDEFSNFFTGAQGDSWLHGGRDGGDHDVLHFTTGVGCKLGWIPRSSGLSSPGVSSTSVSTSMSEDSWEVRDGLCIRHHCRSRRTLFDPHDHECPVPLHRLLPACNADIEFEDGNKTKMEYNWHHPSQMVSMSRPWKSRTIFSIKKNVTEHSLCLMSNKSGRRMRAQLRQAMMLRKVEYEFLQRPQSHSCRSRCVDLLETFAGVGKLSKWAGQYGLKSLLPVDYNTGFDLKKTEGSKKVDEMLKEHEPLFLLQGIDCRDWCLLQDNVNHIHRLIQLQVRRAKAPTGSSSSWMVQVAFG